MSRIAIAAVIAIGAALIPAGRSVGQEKFPARPIEVIVPALASLMQAKPDGYVLGA